MPLMEDYKHGDTPHETTVITDSDLYGCHNQPRDTEFAEYPIGRTQDGRRETAFFPIPPIGPCKHDGNANDPRCAGCKHIPVRAKPCLICQGTGFTSPSSKCLCAYGEKNEIQP